MQAGVVEGAALTRRERVWRWLSLPPSALEPPSRPLSSAKALIAASLRGLGWGLVVCITTGAISGWIILFVAGPMWWVAGIFVGAFYGALVGVPAAVLTVAVIAV